MNGKNSSNLKTIKDQTPSSRISDTQTHWIITTSCKSQSDSCFKKKKDLINIIKY